MIEYPTYRDYINHNRTFNVVFSTTVAILFSVLIGILLYNIGFINMDWGVLAILLLVSIPAVTFIKEINKYEGVIAYHYIWSDTIRGHLDRRFINQDYGKKHNVSDWRTYLSENKPDGRWNYHVDTKYMEQLARSRNKILIDIAKEYIEIRTALKKNAEDINSELKKANEDLQGIDSELSNLKAKLRITPAGADQYHLDRERKTLSAQRESIREQILELKKRMHAAEEEIQKHDYAFVSQKKRVEEDYKIRSNKYARVATKTIEKNGLKYKIATLKLPEEWINNPIERSII